MNKSLTLKQEQADDGHGQGSLQLRLGISSSSDNGSSPWQVDPWSLAAREEKASLEFRCLDEYCDLQRESRPSAPPQPVGWPPVRALRKNVSAAKPPDAGDDALLLDKVKPPGERPPPMFVKVNLEGCAVGRKVDLQAHRGYGSLSRALQSMFHGFLLLSDGRQWGIAAGNNSKDEDDDDEHGQQVETMTRRRKTSYILLYEDGEGDRMLVGDVPWELFVASVKRLYIAQDTRSAA